MHASVPPHAFPGDNEEGGAQPCGGASKSQRRLASKRLRWSGQARRPPPTGSVLVRATLADGRRADEPGWSAAMSSAETLFGTAVRSSKHTLLMDTHLYSALCSITVLFTSGG